MQFLVFKCIGQFHINSVPAIRRAPNYMERFAECWEVNQQHYLRTATSIRYNLHLLCHRQYTPTHFSPALEVFELIAIFPSSGSVFNLVGLPLVNH